MQELLRANRKNTQGNRFRAAMTGAIRKPAVKTNVSQSGPYRPPGGVEEMQGGGRRVRLEWGAYIIV
ncbi:hypothetical protein FHG87_004474 [Trinorchestia longiramus]|nr:hypothetical protein FHG87_004474 [Trinorchestia longiramus]